MSRSMVKIKANNDHKICMHSEMLASTYDSKSLFQHFCTGWAVKPLVKKLPRQEKS